MAEARWNKGGVIGTWIAVGLTLFQIWQQWPKSGSATQLKEWIIPAALITALLLAAGLHLAATLIARRKRSIPSRTDQSQLVCPYDWSHELIDAQRREIRSWIINEKCKFDDADLFRTRPYLQFRFILSNASIFRVVLMKLSGTIMYANISLDGEPKWVGSALSLAPGERNDCIVRFTFEDPKDAMLLLNVHSGFDFTNLSVQIETAPETKVWDYSFISRTVVGFERIKEKYPKIEITIQKATVSSYYEFDERIDVTDSARKGIFVNTFIKFENPRHAPITITEFKLDTQPDLQRMTPATAGDLHAKGNRIEGRFLREGPLKPNLQDRLPVVAERRVPFEGWLQFYLPNVRPEFLIGKTPTVIIVDESGEEHSRGTAPLEKSEFERH